MLRNASSISKSPVKKKTTQLADLFAQKDLKKQIEAFIE